MVIKKTPNLQLVNKGQIGTAGLYYLMRSLGIDLSLNSVTKRDEIYEIRTVQKRRNLLLNTILNISEQIAEEITYKLPEKINGNNFELISLGVGEVNFEIVTQSPH